MQQLDKWWYQTGVSRIQTSAKPKGKLVIFADTSDSFNYLVVYDVKTGKVRQPTYRGGILYPSSTGVSWCSRQVGRLRLFQFLIDHGEFRILRLNDSLTEFSIEKSGSSPVKMDSSMGLASIQNKFVFLFSGGQVVPV